MKKDFDFLIKLGYSISVHGKIYNPDNKEIVGTEDRYKYFTIRIDNRSSVKIKFHKFQAYCKYGDLIFEKGKEVRHLNSNAFDNSWNNICLGSHSENMMDKPKEQRILDASNPKYNHEDIIKDNQNGMSYKDLMLKYNISSKGTVSYIIKKSLKSAPFA